MKVTLRYNPTPQTQSRRSTDLHTKKKGARFMGHATPQRHAWLKFRLGGKLPMIL